MKNLAGHSKLFRRRSSAIPFVKTLKSTGLLLARIGGWIITIFTLPFVLLPLVVVPWWLFDKNVNDFSALIGALDVLLVAAVMFLFRSQSVRKHLKELWRQLWGAN